MSVIYKPSTSKGPVLIIPQEAKSAPTITLENGTVVTAVRAGTGGASGVYNGHEGKQWVFPSQVLGQKNATLSVDGNTQKLDNTNMSYRGGSVGGLGVSTKGAVGDTTSGSGSTNGYQNVGEYGVAPQFIGDKFPNPVFSENAADKYRYIDPIKFGQDFVPSQTKQLATNFANSKGFALDVLDTEFAGINNYVSKSSALKRSEIGTDNAFNQAQRTAQVNAAVPDVQKDLNSVAADARSYASGNVPNAVANNALALGTRSAAADVASSSGFGVNSSAARKVSDLMSAEDRIKLSQYGEGLLSSNAAQRTELNLAPTAYSTVGSDIATNPGVSAGQSQVNLYNTQNQATLLSPETSFQSGIQQQQFVTSSTQQNTQFNTSNANNFALSYFNYLNSYTNAVAGAGQTNVNTTLSINQQQQAADIAQKFRKQSQDRQATKDILGAIGNIAAASYAASDKRLKDNVSEYVTGSLDVSKLHIINYKYKEDSIVNDGGKPHIGVFAQDLQEVFPTAVMEHSEGYLQINPTEIIFALVGAVQDLQRKVAELENGR
jgi:hypothetical protein